MRSVFFLAVAAFWSSLAAQRVVGTILVAHGADSTWNAPIEALANGLHTGGPVRVSYLMGPAAASHRFQDAVAELLREGATEVLVVPILISSYSGHFRQVEWLVGDRDSLDDDMADHLAHAGIMRPAAGASLGLLPALDGAPEMGDVLADRVRELLAGRAPQTRAVLLVGHGPTAVEDHAAWMTAFRQQGTRLEASLGLADVRVGVVRDDAPPAVRAEAVQSLRDLIALQAAVTGDSVLVIPVVISSGGLNRVRFPHDFDGLPVEYSPTPLLPHPAMTAWVERVVRAAVERLPASR